MQPGCLRALRTGLHVQVEREQMPFYVVPFAAPDVLSMNRVTHHDREWTPSDFIDDRVGRPRNECQVWQLLIPFVNSL